jgi:predicted alpha/beta-fold hydrolase
MAKVMLTNGYDVLTWNYRGCSEELNKQKRFYHSGATDDLDTVVVHAIKKGYTSIYLVGFSLGGNITLKYLGEDRQKHMAIKKAATLSVPMDLGTSCDTISTPRNFLYSRRFLKSLADKVLRKSKVWNDIDVSALSTIKTLRKFDDAYTAPLHGFQNAADYYKKCSSIHFVNDISIPTLILNAENDPFLSKECYPIDLLKNHQAVKLEIPSHGGHVGFAQFGQNGLYWSEQRTLQFFKA